MHLTAADQLSTVRRGHSQSTCTQLHPITISTSLSMTSSLHRKRSLSIFLVGLHIAQLLWTLPLLFKRFGSYMFVHIPVHWLLPIMIAEPSRQLLWFKGTLSWNDDMWHGSHHERASASCRCCCCWCNCGEITSTMTGGLSFLKTFTDPAVGLFTNINVIMTEMTTVTNFIVCFTQFPAKMLNMLGYFHVFFKNPI